MGIGHSLFRSAIQFSNGDNEPVSDVLWVERKSSDTLTLNVLIMVTDPRKQQYQHWDQHYDDPGSIKKLHRGHHQGNQARGYSPHSIDQQTAQPAALYCT